MSIIFNNIFMARWHRSHSTSHIQWSTLFTPKVLLFGWLNWMVQGYGGGLLFLCALTKGVGLRIQNNKQCTVLYMVLHAHNTALNEAEHELELELKKRHPISCPNRWAIEVSIVRVWEKTDLCYDCTALYMVFLWYSYIMYGILTLYMVFLHYIWYSYTIHGILTQPDVNIAMNKIRV